MPITNELLRRSFVRSTNFQVFRQVARITLFSVGLCLAATVATRAQVTGQNVNMVSGTNWTNGDPFLQRQNEPSIAVSSRNSSHLLAGANDYRTVDLPGALGIDERGDAWLGLFKSFDGGRTWQSTLLSGFPLDGSPQGQASPIHGFQAASDPTVRAGTNGLFYYTGVAFNRTGNLPKSAVFVSRFVDLNNKENGDATFESGSMTNLQPRDTIKYIDTTVVDRGGIPGTPGAATFLDKPWVAVDIPRSGATCTISVEEDGKIITQTIPAAPVYMTYTSFVGNGPVQSSNINFRRSLDCGATWSSAAILSRNDEPSGVPDGQHQGTVIAIDPSVPSSQPATVYVAWRRFATPSDPDEPPAIFLAKSADGGAHWGTAFAVVMFPSSCINKPTGVGCPFDQIFTNTSFRSNGYPALTVDSNGRVYIAWSQRDANGDGKIMMGIAPGGRSIQSASIAPVDIGSVADDDGNAFSNLSGHGSQLMPSLSFAAGKLMLAYYDLRQDHTTGTFVQKPDPNCDPLITLPCILGGQYIESRTLEGELGPPNPPNNPAVFGSYVADSAPPLTVRRHTIDVMGAEAVPPPASSLQAPSFKTFRITHYLFGSIPQLFQDVEQIQFNAPNLPLFINGTAPFMGDYIDVSGAPQIIADGKGGWTFNTNPSANPVFHAAWTDNRDVVPPADGNWQNYTPPISASNPGSQPSKFDPTQQPLSCVVGQTGMRNQNVYTAEISQGVVLTSPQTSKPVLTPAGQPIQRAFVVELRNASNAARSFRVNIPTQPATATASFSQFASMITQTVKVNAFSSQSFPVFVVANAGSTVAFPSVLVTATENDGVNPPLTGSVLLNPDPTNPALASPDNAAIGANQISVNEFYNPGVANPGVANSGVPSPGVANPGVANPGVANPGVANPTVVVALNPGVANPGVANPGVANPGVANPGVANESVTDASYTFTNEGNTSAAYTIQFFQSAPFPTGAKFQIILSKVYFTEQAVGCQIQQVGTNVIVANVTNPAFVTDPTRLGNPGVANLGVQTPTINLAPGDSGQITIRTNLSVAQVESQVLPNVSPVAVAQAVNTVDVQNGIFTPPLNLIVTSTSASLPVGVVNQPYNTSLTSIGGNVGPLNWTISSGFLPPGLQLNAASGAISGTPTQAGSFAFTAQVMDTGVPQHTATRALTITVNAPPLVFTSSKVPTAVVGRPYNQALPVAGGTQPYNGTVSNGTLPPGLTVAGNMLTGTPSGTGNFTVTVTVTDSSTPMQTATQTLAISVNTLVITTTALPNGIVGVPYNAAISTAGGTLPVSYSLTTAAFPPGLSIQQPGPGSSSAALAGTPTLAGTYTFSESVVDSSNPLQTATQNYVVTIAPAGSAVPANVTFAREPLNSVGGQTLAGGPIVVRVADATNTPIPGTAVALTLTGNFNPAPPCSVATLSGTLAAVTDATGQATFSNLSIDRGGFNYALLASTGSASQSSGPFSVQGFCASGNLSTPREGHTQDLLGTAQSTFKFPVDPKGAYIFTNTNPGPSGTPDIANAPLTIPLASLGIKPGNVISGLPVGDMDFCSVGSFCFGEIFNPGLCAVFSTSNTLLPTGGTINRIPGAITPDFTTAFPCITPPTLFGNLPTDIPQDFFLFGERVTVPPGAAYLFVAVSDSLYTDNSDPNGDFGVEITVNSASSVNGNVLIAGGFDNSGNVLNNAEFYHPLLGFTSPTGNLTDPNGRASHVSVVLADGRVLLIGGTSNIATVASAELYDPAVGTFSATGSMSLPRVVPAAVMLADGRVLVSGGVNTNVATSTAEIYDPRTGLFTSTGNMNQARTRHTMTLLPNGKVLVTGGRDNQQNFFAFSSAEIFDPFANQGVGAFTAIGNMNSPRFKHTATLLSNGTVLIAGGFNGGNTSASVASAEIFDPKTNVFTPTGSMNTPRGRHTSTLLPDGTVLEAGGINGFNGVIAAAPAEIYSPTSGTFSLTGPMITGRELPAATLLLPDGNVLLSGGDDGVNVLASTEIYYNTVAQAPIVITTASVPNGFIGQPYVQLLLEQNRSGPITWSLASGTLPPGIILGANGILSGTPTAVGSFTFTVQVTDGISTTTASFTINVSLPGVNTSLVITTTALPAGTIGAAYSQTLTATGGVGTYTWTLASGILPPGVTLASSGLLSGMPTTGGTFTFTVQVTDLSFPAQTATQALSIQVASTTVPAGSHILFIVQPPGPPGGGSIGLQAVVQVFDANNAPIAGALLSASFGAKPCSDAALSGTLTALTDSNGLAAFSGITSNRGGNGYTGVATATSNPQVFATSIPFNIQGFCPTGNLSTARQLNTSTLLPSGKVLVAGGFSGGTFFNSAELYDPNTGLFTPTGSMGAARSFHTATRLPNGKVLIAGGSSVNTTLQSAELYDPATGVFTATGNMNAIRGGHTATLLPNGKVLIAGGFSVNTTIQSAELYDPATGVFTATGDMHVAREQHTATLLANGTVLITGGDDNNNNLQVTAEVYDPSLGSFTLTGSMSTPRVLHAAALLPNGKVLVVGGLTSTSAFQGTASAEVYDPALGTFSPTGSLSATQEAPAVTLLPNGTVLVSGLTLAEIYDPATGSFHHTGSSSVGRQQITTTLLPNGTVLAAGGNPSNPTAEIFYPIDPPFLVEGFSPTSSTMTTPRRFHTVTLLPSGKVLISGGDTSTTVSGTTSSEIFDPTTNSFTATGSMFAARAGHRATLLTNGKVLITGGRGLGGLLASAELYDLGSETFSLTGSMTTARMNHTSTLLPDGRVLLTGGGSISGSVPAVNAAEVYDGTSGTFAAVGPMNTARVGHTATLLPNGKVLVAGGQDGSAALASVELFDPGTNTFTVVANMSTPRYIPSATLLPTGKVLIFGGQGANFVQLSSAELFDPATNAFSPTGSPLSPSLDSNATLLPNGKVLISGGFTLGVGQLYDPQANAFALTANLIAPRRGDATVKSAPVLPNGRVLLTGGEGESPATSGTILNSAETYVSGSVTQLQPQSCSYEGHIKSVAAFSTPAAIQFVNNSPNLSFQVFWLDYNGNRVLYNTLSPGQSFIQQTFLTHPWVIADTSPAAVCQEIYLPLQEQAPAIFPPQASVSSVFFSNVSTTVPPGSGGIEGSSFGPYIADAFEFSATTTGTFTGARIDLWTYTADGAVTASLYSDAGGTPGTLLAQLGTTTVPFFSSFPFLPFAANNTSFTQTSGPPVALVAGSNYWLVLTPGDATSFLLYAIGGATANVTQAQQLAPGGAWISAGPNNNVQFEIDGTIP